MTTAAVAHKLARHATVLRLTLLPPTQTLLAVCATQNKPEPYVVWRHPHTLRCVRFTPDGAGIIVGAANNSPPRPWATNVRKPPAEEVAGVVLTLSWNPMLYFCARKRYAIAAGPVLCRCAERAARKRIFWRFVPSDVSVTATYACLCASFLCVCNGRCWFCAAICDAPAQQPVTRSCSLSVRKVQNRRAWLDTT